MKPAPAYIDAFYSNPGQLLEIITNRSGLDRINEAVENARSAGASRIEDDSDFSVLLRVDPDLLPETVRKRKRKSGITLIAAPIAGLVVSIILIAGLVKIWELAKDLLNT